VAAAPCCWGVAARKRITSQLRRPSCRWATFWLLLVRRDTACMCRMAGRAAIGRPRLAGDRKPRYGLCIGPCSPAAVTAASLVDLSGLLALGLV